MNALRSAASTTFAQGETSGRPCTCVFAPFKRPFCSPHGATSSRNVMAFGLLSRLGFGRDSSVSTSGDNQSGKKGDDGSILQWARIAKQTCRIAPQHAPDGLEIATFAGGCFWGLQLAVDRLPGIVESTVGYTGGHDTNPSYNSVCSGRTGHAEAVQAYFDPKVVSYSQVLDSFFANVDPTTKNRQGGDVGSQYRSAIYFHSPAQQRIAQEKSEEVNTRLAKSAFRRVLGSKVVTQLEPASDYYIAEGYHQKYLQKGGRFGLAQSAEKGCEDKIRPNLRPLTYIPRLVTAKGK